MASLSTRPTISTTGISAYVEVYEYVDDRMAPSSRSKRLAARFLADGYRVTDHHGFDLTVQDRTDMNSGTVTRHLARGNDAYASYLDNHRHQTIARSQAQGLHASGRPANLPPRQPTDYESGKVHTIYHCETPNCDHPVHFGGSETGELKRAPADKNPSDTDERRGGDGDSGAGGAAAAGAAT